MKRVLTVYQGQPEKLMQYKGMKFLDTRTEAEKEYPVQRKGILVSKATGKPIMSLVKE